METFLNHIAKDLIRKFQNRLQDIVLVFPNKRASLFMNEFLAQASDKPVWAPSYISISELFRQFSTFEVPDKIRLVCELYPIYRELRHQTEEEMPLDRFYSWGELLLADFDDLDKNMVPADKLYQNLKELKEMDNTGFLSDEQKEALSLFFNDFQFRETEIQQEFIRVWDILLELYTRYKEHLAAQNLLYEGALFRKVAEELTPAQLKAKQYVFVGFSVLDKAEQTLFRKIQEAGKALFYWDYDQYYLNATQGNMEAGFFLRKNIQEFGNCLDESCFQSMSQPKEVEIISAATENAQVCHVSPWLDQNLTQKESETAVVLCNETLLEPVLHGLSSKVENLNITMGFPLSSTPIYSFIKTLCDLHLTGYNKEKGCYRYAQVRSVLLHPYTQMISDQAQSLLAQLTADSRFLATPLELGADEALASLFPAQCLMDSPLNFLMNLQKQAETAAHCLNSHKEDLNATFAPLYREALFNAYTLMNRLIKLVEDKILTVNAKTLLRFINQLMGSSSIPFHGEPVIGLQVMGVLETRCLDFKHLILLSLNEGMLPKGGNNASFIPYNLRKAFGMTLIEQKIAVYAYYFYRLIQRAEKVTFIYNNNTEGLQKGEMSRFLLQYLIEHPAHHKLSLQTLTTDQMPILSQDIIIQKTPQMMQKLLRHYQSKYHKDGKEKYSFLSPSALNTYINCPLEFYFKYVAHIRVPEEVSDDIDNALFGTIFHRCSEKIYLHLTHGTGNGDIVASSLETILKNENFLRTVVNDTIKEEVFKINKSEDMPTLNGIQIIIQRVMLRYVRQLLERDLSLCPFTIRGLEKPILDKLPFRFQDKEEWVYIGGDIDRIDEYTEGTERILRIIDYKTSGSPQKAGTLEALFQNGVNGRQYHALQAFYYAMQVNSNGLNPQHLCISPSLFYIQKAAADDYRPTVELSTGDKKTEAINNFEEQIGTDYRQLLREKIEELFSTTTPFTQCDGHHCEFCDYKNLCRK